MSIERSPEMILAAFFLAKYGEGGVHDSHPRPPREFGDVTWREVYERHFPKLGGGRDLKTFVGSFDHARKYYRDYLARRTRDYFPGRGQVTDRRREVLAPWLDRPREEVWAAVQQFLDSPPTDGNAEAGSVLPEEIVQTDGLVEGAIRTITINAYERNPEARRRCIAHYGASCMACGFDFGTTYGEFADGFIHVHHVKPLSEIGTEYVVDPVADLRPVCPNCHAVIHLGGSCRSIDEIRRLLGRDTV